MILINSKKRSKKTIDKLLFEKYDQYFLSKKLMKMIVVFNEMMIEM